MVGQFERQSPKTDQSNYKGIYDGSTGMNPQGKAVLSEYNNIPGSNYKIDRI